MSRLIPNSLLALLLMSMNASLPAQDREPLVKPEHQIEAARKSMRAERRLVIASELVLTSEESEAFWPVFNEFEAELTALGDERVRLITSYAENFERMTPEYAERLLKDSQDLEASYLKLRRKYVRKFKKVLPVIKVARFYQIDSKLEAAIKYQLAATIPLIEK